MLRYFKKH